MRRRGAKTKRQPLQSPQDEPSDQEHQYTRGEHAADEDGRGIGVAHIDLPCHKAMYSSRSNTVRTS